VIWVSLFVNLEALWQSTKPYSDSAAENGFASASVAFAAKAISFRPK
jgi:hypothetical protein